MFNEMKIKRDFETGQNKTSQTCSFATTRGKFYYQI